MQTSLSRAASSFEFPSVERATISTGLSDKQIDKYLQSPPAEKLAAPSSGSLKQRISFFFKVNSYSKCHEGIGYKYGASESTERQYPVMIRAMYMHIFFKKITLTLVIANF